ncbi:hypothetical protein Tco_1114353 [Tanacetum coccineum]|uniref:Uncharacterized protein n=1 Tax=Tanacetum coccineum TaxID=301880 RepID=A0ABQ5IWE5_9ASTR
MDSINCIDGAASLIYCLIQPVIWIGAGHEEAGSYNHIYSNNEYHRYEEFIRLLQSNTHTTSDSFDLLIFPAKVALCDCKTKLQNLFSLEDRVDQDVNDDTSEDEPTSSKQKWFLHLTVSNNSVVDGSGHVDMSDRGSQFVICGDIKTVRTLIRIVFDLMRRGERMQFEIRIVFDLMRRGERMQFEVVHNHDISGVPESAVVLFRSILDTQIWLCIKFVYKMVYTTAANWFRSVYVPDLIHNIPGVPESVDVYFLSVPVTQMCLCARIVYPSYLYMVVLVTVESVYEAGSFNV